MTKATRKSKPFWEMTASELAEATREFDTPETQPRDRPLNAAERALHRRAAKRGRPRVGAGSERINVTIERTLLGQADKLAKATGLSRAQLIAIGLRHAIDAQSGGSKTTTRTTKKKHGPASAAAGKLVPAATRKSA